MLPTHARSAPAPFSLILEQLLTQCLVKVVLMKHARRENPSDEKQAKEDRREWFGDVVQRLGAETRIADAETQRAQEQKGFCAQGHSLPCDLLCRSQAPRSPGGAALPPFSSELLTAAHLPRVRIFVIAGR